MKLREVIRAYRDVRGGRINSRMSLNRCNGAFRTHGGGICVTFNEAGLDGRWTFTIKLTARGWPHWAYVSCRIFGKWRRIHGGVHA